MYGGGGADHLEGDDGNDRLSGGKGNDILLGERGDDILIGGFGDDLIYGGVGNDTIYAGAGDFISTGLGRDVVHIDDSHGHGLIVIDFQAYEIRNGNDGPIARPTSPDQVFINNFHGTVRLIDFREGHDEYFIRGGSPTIEIEPPEVPDPWSIGPIPFPPINF